MRVDPSTVDWRSDAELVLGIGPARLGIFCRS